ncbi:MAG: glycosyltransferase family 2 protein [Methylacidiphilales bacterium]|nr:glycosyltransferase family 2 protein [Candidatus Methylacidiphilales bacterium]
MTPQKARYCVLAPTYNNAPTLDGVLRGVLKQTSDIIVVNDGSTDGTQGILDRFPAITQLRHTANYGKGAALRAGLKLAVKLGYTHAISLDSDGQHRPEDLSKFIEALQASPDALVIGNRNLRGAGPQFKSRLLRFNSNFWTWVITGRWIQDSQSGFRAYPLHAVSILSLGAMKYDFESEALIKLCWKGIPVIHVPIEVLYHTKSPSHFRYVRDSALVVRLNCRLMARRFLFSKHHEA